MSLFDPERLPAGRLIGVDEVGRGPLAGNVVAAAVILDPAAIPAGLADSKRLTATRRQQLAEVIRSEAVAWAIGEASPAEIDASDILQATFLAMRRAVMQIAQPGDQVWVDGRHCPPALSCPCQAVIRGDARVPAISAAAILAKVHRDAQMVELDARWPEYGFARHKGYPTAAHLDALRRFGVIEGVHRRSFRPVRDVLAHAEKR